MKDIFLTLKPRLKNVGTWIAFFALVPMVAQIFGLKLPENFAEAINALLTFLVAMGILNNASIGTGYSDPE